MHETPTVGTYRLDGMLEGPLGDDPQVKARLADWIRIAEASGYGFSLDVEGDRFNLLAASAVRPSGAADVSEPLRDLLEQLVTSFAPHEQPDVFSTVRSLQWGEGVETQTIYQVMPDGRVEAQQRTVDASTSRPPQPISSAGKAKRIGIAALVLLAIFGITSIFIDWGETFTKALRKVVPVDTATIDTDLGALEPYITVTGIEAKGSMLHLTLERTEVFPKDVAAVERALEENGLSYEVRQTLHALAAGYVRLEGFDEKERHLDTMDVRLAELRTAETMTVKFRIKRETPPELLRFTW